MADIKDCCKREENLVVIENRPEVLVKRCSVCNCRHFRAFMNEGTMKKVDLRGS